MDTNYFKKLFEYDYWANEKVLDSLESMTFPPDEAVKKISHILMAKATWLSRITTLEYAPDLNRELTLAECRKLNGEFKTKLGTFLAGLPDGKLSEKISYKNTKGASFESLLSDILAQLITHGPYHRGQIASLIKKAGGTPPATDFILFVRE